MSNSDAEPIENEENQAPQPPSDDSQLSPRSRAMKQTIHDRSLKGFSVKIVKNAFPRSQPRRYRLESIEKLLSEALSLLSLPSPAKKIFKEDGAVVKTIDDVAEGDTLYLSCGEKFGYGASPVKRPLPKYEPIPAARDDEHDDKNQEDEHNKKLTSPTLTKDQKNKIRFDTEVLSFQRILAIANRTVDEAMKETTASVYAALLENQRRRLPNWYQLQYAHDETQMAKIIEHLVNLKICPSKATIIPEVNDYSMDLFRGMETSDIRFAIAGPRQSGKTTLLHTVTRALMRKLQSSDEASQYLLFPLNFKLEAINFTSHLGLLKCFIKTAFDALAYSSFAFLPYLSQLRKWFVMTVFGSSIVFPTELSQYPNVDIKELQNIPKVLHNNLFTTDKKAVEKDGLVTFIQSLVEFPGLFAKALGFRDIIYVIDNFDAIRDIYLIPGPDSFPQATKPVYLPQKLCSEIQNHLYIIAGENEQNFMECFTCNNAALLDTIGILDFKDDGSIIVRQPPLRISIEDCLGCPGYINKYQNIVDVLLHVQENSAVPSQYANVKTSSDQLRLSVAKHEIVRLAEYLSDAGSSLITKDLLNRLNDEETLIVKYSYPMDDEEEESSNEEAGPGKKSNQPNKATYTKSQNPTSKKGPTFESSEPGHNLDETLENLDDL